MSSWSYLEGDGFRPSMVFHTIGERLYSEHKLHAVSVEVGQDEFFRPVGWKITIGLTTALHIAAPQAAHKHLRVDAWELQLNIIRSFGRPGYNSRCVRRILILLQRR